MSYLCAQLIFPIDVEKTINMQQQFFSLLCAGLWNAPADTSLFGPDTDWAEIYKMGKRQTVTGILLDGIQTLPAECRPSRALYLQWCSDLMVIEEKNHLLNRELANILAKLQEKGIEPVLVKGQGVAQNYREPLHRQSGDIDLYIGAKDFEAANRLLLEDGRIIEEEDFKHIAIERYGVCVENHRVLINLSSPVADHRLQQETNRWHGNHHLCKKVRLENCEVLTPPDAFNVSYLLIHILKHFLSEGIGIRQLCDWACLLYHLPDEEERMRAGRLLKALNLEKTARIFGYILKEYMGLPASCLPVPILPQDEAIAQWLLNDIWTGGNFGKHDEVQRRRLMRHYWTRKLETFFRVLRRCRELGSIAPSEARWYPWALAVQSIRTECKRRSGKHI